MVTAEELMERFNITKEQAGYIIKESVGLKVSIDNRSVKQTNTANSRGEVIEGVFFDWNKHSCYM